MILKLCQYVNSIYFSHESNMAAMRGNNWSIRICVICKTVLDVYFGDFKFWLVYLSSAILITAYKSKQIIFLIRFCQGTALWCNVYQASLEDPYYSIVNLVLDGCPVYVALFQN